MLYLGRVKAGALIFYGANFKNDSGTLEDPTALESQLRDCAGIWLNLSTPTKQNNKTGFYGGTIDTTGFAVGQYVIRMAGTVTSSKNVATAFCFEIITDMAVDILKYDISTITDEPKRSLVNAIRKLVNRISNSGTLLTIFKEDDTAVAFTQTVVEDGTRGPIKELDTV